jgi:proline iminopeptidase
MSNFTSITLDSVLYPSIEPFQETFLRVSDLHTLYFEECGNPQGKPVLFIHGGPGGGIQSHYRRYFDPKIYHIILVDQRGCGKSTPHAETRENTTSLLISDFEKIRENLNIKKWQIFGGSWGSTLALAYAEAHPSVVTELVLRGIFLGRSKELDWMYQWGCSEVFPEAWADFIQIIPEEERDNFRLAYHKKLTSPDQNTRYQAAKAWSIWEGSISKLFYDPTMVKHYGDPEFALAFARIENHYFMNDLFFTPNQLMNEVHKIKHIPTFIVHGRYDMCCPVTNAWELHQAFPESELHIIPDAGHSMSEIGIAKKLVEITNRLAP